jgi:hypothetical protein
MDEKMLVVLKCPSCGAQTPIETERPLKHFTCAACGKHHEAKECVGCDFSDKCPMHAQASAP